MSPGADKGGEGLRGPHCPERVQENRVAFSCILRHCLGVSAPRDTVLGNFKK
jgi:hypothetical protein